MDGGGLYCAALRFALQVKQPEQADIRLKLSWGPHQKIKKEIN
jgi:hypothetical protein